MVAGAAGLILTRNLFSPSPLVLIPQAAGTALMIWARVTFGRRSFHCAANPTAGGLVTTGPYRFARHPIYTGVCLFVLAGAAAHPSWLSGSLGVVVWTGGVCRMLCEERLLLAVYPEYRQYAAKTARMLPFVF